MHGVFGVVGFFSVFSQICTILVRAESKFPAFIHIFFSSMKPNVEFCIVKASGFLNVSLKYKTSFL